MCTPRFTNSHGFCGRLLVAEPWALKFESAWIQKTSLGKPVSIGSDNARVYVNVVFAQLLIAWANKEGFILILNVKPQFIFSLRFIISFQTIVIDYIY